MTKENNPSPQHIGEMLAWAQENSLFVAIGGDGHTEVQQIHSKFGDSSSSGLSINPQNYGLIGSGKTPMEALRKAFKNILPIEALIEA